MNALCDVETTHQADASRGGRRLDTVKMCLVGGTHYMPRACNVAPEEVIVMYELLPPELLQTFRLVDGRTS